MATFQTSLTPSSQTCGSRSSARSNSRIAAPVRWPQQPSASTVALGLDVGAGLEVAERLAVLAAALVAGAHAEHAPVLDEQLRGRGLGEDVGAALLGLPLLEARQRRHRDDLVAVVLERRRRRDAQRDLATSASCRRPPWYLAEGEALPRATARASYSGNSSSQRLGAHDRARQVVPAARLRLLDDRDRHFAQALHRLRVVAEQLQQAVGAGQPGRAAADDRDADLDQLVLVVEPALDELLLRVDRRRERGRARCRCRCAPAMSLSCPSSPSPPRSAWAGSCSGRRRCRGRRIRRSARWRPC